MFLAKKNCRHCAVCNTAIRAASYVGKMSSDLAKSLITILLTSLPVKNNLTTRLRFPLFTKLRDCEIVNLCLSATFSRLNGGYRKQTVDGYIVTNVLEKTLHQI